MKVYLRVTMLVEDDWNGTVDDEVELDHARFFYEENHCMGNHVVREARRIESRPGICDVCAGRMKVEFLGTKRPPEMGDERK